MSKGVNLINVPGKITIRSLQSALDKITELTEDSYFRRLPFVRIQVSQASGVVSSVNAAPVSAIALVELTFKFDEHLNDWILL